MQDQPLLPVANCDADERCVPCYDPTSGEPTLATGACSINTCDAPLEDPIELKDSRMQTPTLIVRGERDPIVPERWVHELAALLPDSEIVTLPGGTHAVNYSAPKELVRETCEFLNRHPSSAV